MLEGVRRSRHEGRLHFGTGVFGGLLDRRSAAENDQVGHRDLLAEVLLDCFEFLQHRRKLLRLIDHPIFLRAQANACAVRAATLVGTAERRSRRRGGAAA